MIKSLFFIFVLFSASYLYSQSDECKVLKPEISGTYQGGCKKGLAQGKGVARGTDSYEGQFDKGLPSGKGTYKWASGAYYEGQWKKGLREGEGRMVYPDSVVTGLWTKDKYMGKRMIPAYNIITSMSVSRFSIAKSADNNPGVKIRIMQGGSDNVSIEDLSLAYDSGSEYRNMNYYGIQNVIFPVGVKVKYRSWNQLRTAQYDVIFEFTINQPGNWDVLIYN
jgi:hypothetical protein